MKGQRLMKIAAAAVLLLVLVDYQRGLCTARPTNRSV